MSNTGLHATVAMPNKQAEEAKKLWEEQTNPDLSSTQKILQTINFKLGNFDDENRSFRAIASTPMVDRQGDTIDQAGWVLDNFIKNPVIPWAHCYWELPVARATEIGVQDGNLVMNVQFPPEGVYEFADTVWQMYRNQFMFAFSVGFIPLEYDGNWEDGYNFTKCELLEVSAVPVPANAGALVLSQQMGYMDEKQAKQMIQKMEEAIKNLKEAGNVGKKVVKSAPKSDEVAPKSTETVADESKPVTLKEIREILKELLEEKPVEAPVEAVNTEEGEAEDTTEKSEGLTNGDDMVQTDNMSEQKSGASISNANKEKIKAVMDGLKDVMDSIQSHHDALGQLYNVGADSEDDARNDDPDADDDNDGKDKGIEDSKPEAKKVDDVEAEVKSADEVSDDGAEQEDKEADEEVKSEEADKEVEASEEEATEDDKSEEEESSEEVSTEEKSVEAEEDDLVDPENLSDEDIAKIAAAVQAELDKEEE